MPQLSKYRTDGPYVSTKESGRRHAAPRYEDVVEARHDFRRRAIVTAMLLDQGWTALTLARLGKQAIRADPELRGELYVSPTTVLIHGRTGSILMLPGELPTGISARDLQALVTRLPAQRVEVILGRSRTQGEAYAELVRQQPS